MRNPIAFLDCSLNPASLFLASSTSDTPWISDEERTPSEPVADAKTDDAGIEDRGGIGVLGMINPSDSALGMGKIEDVERIDTQRERPGLFQMEILGQAQIYVIESG